MRPRWLRGGDGDAGATTPAVGYLWNPADPRSYEARRRSGRWETPGSPAVEPAVVWRAAREEDTRLPILPAADAAGVGRTGSFSRSRWPAAVVVGAAVAIGVAAGLGAFSSDRQTPATSRSATSPPAIVEERSTVDDAGQTNIPAESPVDSAPIVELSPRESYLQALQTSQDRVRGAIPVFDGFRRASPDFVTVSVSRVGVFALLLDSLGSALNRSLSDLRRLEPPVEFRTDHGILTEFYAGALELNRGARGRARGSDFGGADFRIVMLEIERLELGHAVRLSRDACLVLIDGALCPFPGAAPAGEYGASLNIAVRELAALRSATSPELPFPAQSEEDDLAVARTRIDWQLSDLVAAHARIAALQPPAEFVLEHAALLEVVAGAASHLLVQRERLGHTQIGARLVVPNTICLQESRFGARFRRLAPIALLPQELLCPPPFTFADR